MNSSTTKLKTRAEEETYVNELVDEFLTNHDPEKMDNVVFRGARFDAGLAWIHFPEGEGGLGMRPNLQRIIGTISLHPYTLASENVFFALRYHALRS